jgi:hypothetical protein
MKKIHWSKIVACALLSLGSHACCHKSIANYDIRVAVQTRSGANLECDKLPCVPRGQGYSLLVEAKQDMNVLAFRMNGKFGEDICISALSRIDYIGKAELRNNTLSNHIKQANLEKANPIAPLLEGHEEIYLVGIRADYYSQWMKQVSDVEATIISRLRFLTCSRIPGCHIDKAGEDPPPVKDVLAKSEAEVMRFQRVAILRK